ncbi:MAG: ABC transporter permease [Acidaminococcales bacterium]|jgi:NitT/TauT family transport system permease protein|nr:ABC transporter permease [Acidaminococcales bacterium]
MFRTSRIGRWLKKSAVICFVLFLWQVGPSLGIIDERTLPSFLRVLSEWLKIMFSGELPEHIYISLQRSLAGFFLAVATAIPLGVAMGWFNRVNRIFNPIVQLFRNTASLALYPVVLLIFGLGETAKIGIIFWGALWPLLINTIEGVNAVSPIYIKAARTMNVSTFQLFVKVVLPASIPFILTGLRISATRSIVVLVAAEMLGASSGLGYLIFDAQHKEEIEKMYSAIITLISLGMIVNLLLVKLERKLTVWKDCP